MDDLLGNSKKKRRSSLSFLGNQLKEMVTDEVKFVKDTANLNRKRAMAVKKQQMEEQKKYGEYREEAYRKEYNKMIKKKAKEEAILTVRKQFGLGEKNAMSRR